NCWPDSSAWKSPGPPRNSSPTPTNPLSTRWNGPANSIASSCAAIRSGNWPWTIWRSEEHTSELQSRENLVCRLLLEKKKKDPRGRTRSDEPDRHQDRERVTRPQARAGGVPRQPPQHRRGLAELPQLLVREARTGHDH